MIRKFLGTGIRFVSSLGSKIPACCNVHPVWTGEGILPNTSWSPSPILVFGSAGQPAHVVRVMPACNLDARTGFNGTCPVG